MPPGKIDVDLTVDRETISDAMNKVNAASNALDETLGDLSKEFAEVRNTADLSDETIDELESGLNELNTASRAATKAQQRLESVLEDFRDGTISASTAADRLDSAMADLARTEAAAERSANSLNNELDSLSASSMASSQSMKSFRSSVATAATTVGGYSQILGENTQEKLQNAGASRAAKAAQSGLNREINQGTAAMGTYNTQAGLMATITEALSLETGSLSINIGSFNVALKQLSIQIPAILAGMGALLSVVVSLVAAFGALAAATGLIFAAGAVGFVEEMEESLTGVEDTMETVAAIAKGFADALREAIDPLVNAQSISAFVGLLESVVDALSIFSQWVDDNRGEFGAFFDQIEFSLNDFLDTLMDVFITMRPFLVDLINFFTTGLTDGLSAFADAAAGIIPSLQKMFGAVSSLAMELIQLVSTIINGVVPIVVLLMGTLEAFFSAINAINPAILQMAVTLVTLIVAATKVSGIITALSGVVGTLSGAITAAAASGSLLGQVFLSLISISSRLVAGTMTQATATKALVGLKNSLISRLWAEITAKAASIKTTLQQISAMAGLAATHALTAAKMSVTALAQWSLVGALWAGTKAIGAQIKRIPALIAGFGGVILSLLSTAGAYVTATLAAISFQAVTGGMLKIAATLTGLLVGLAGAFGFLSQGMGEGAGIMDVLSESFQLVVDIIKSLLIPAINLILAPFRLIATVVGAIANGFGILAEAFGFASSKGEQSASAFDKIFNAVKVLISPITLLMDIISLLFNVFGQLLAAGITAYFKLVAKVIGGVVDIVAGLVDKFLKFIGLGGGLQGIMDFLNSLKNPLDVINDLIAGFINKLNMIPGVDIDAPDIGTRARDEIQGEQEEEAEPTKRESQVDLSIEERTEQNIDVDADPEKQEQLKRVVKDAMREADSEARRREGHPG